MGFHAVEALLRKEAGRVIVQQKGEFRAIPLTEAIEMPKVFRQDIYDIASVLSI